MNPSKIKQRNKSQSFFLSFAGKKKKDMEALKELAYLVARDQKRSIGHIDDPKLKGSKIRKFYDMLLADQLESDLSAATHFYGENAKKDSPAFQKLKTEVTDRLLNTLFFIDVEKPTYNKRKRAYYQCYRQWAAAKILLGKNARKAGIKLCYRILRQARKYEFTELVVDISRILRLHYGIQEGDMRKFEKYNQQFKDYEDIWFWENQAEELYAELVMRFVNHKGNKKAIHEKAKKYYAQLEEALQKYDTYALHLCGFLIKTIIFSSLHDYQKTMEICDEAVQFFEKKKYEASLPLQVFLYQKMECLIQLKLYNEGEITVKKCAKFFEEGDFNWFKSQELYFLLSMHTGEYQQAYKVFDKAVKQRQFKSLPENVQEMWRIYESYVHYLIEANHIKPATGDKRFNKFRLGKFLNETPIFSKDKRGMNIPILVIQILFMILQKKYDKAINRIEAIEKYCSRYLKKDDTYRSNNFIKLLLQIPVSGFHRAGVERGAKKYLQNLHAVPLEMASQTYEIEIIPYEELWGIALHSLDYTAHKVRRR